MIRERTLVIALSNYFYGVSLVRYAVVVYDEATMITKNKILIVEDEKDIAKLLRYNLEKEKYRVTAANDAESALKMVKKNHPDLIILDIMLPKMDGLEFLRKIRPEVEAPILLLTAKRSEMDRILGLKLGA